MHSTQNGRHHSGAERLVAAADLEAASAELLRRALEHGRGCADAIRLSVDAVAAELVATGCLPELATIRVRDFHEGRQAAAALLQQCGVSPRAAKLALETLAAGAAPDGGSMRGAMLVDAESGARLEADHARGVRVSRMDLSLEAETRLRQALTSYGLDNPHVREALVLAGKVLATPGILAELCWSDDPDYTAGYVAAPALGYRRLTALKPLGEERGGRAFFVRGDGLDLARLRRELEESVLLFTDIGAIGGETLWED
jgi:6-carboxyhexanoate--CoA ligase